MRSQQARILVQLRDLILKGAFAPGERLAEIPISARLNASRTPVRLALATLEQEGLVAMSPGGGFLMRAFTRKEIDDAIAVRGVLEGMAARLLAESGLTGAMRRAFEACLAAGDLALAGEALSLDGYADYVEMNDRFHQLLVRFSANAALQRSIEVNNRLPFAAASATLPMHPASGDGRRWLLITHRQHRAIVEAMLWRQGTRAQALAIEHVEVARMNLRFAYEQARDGAEIGPAMRLLVPTGERENA
jgi:GntR family transcriptional regulator of vanillate catabolism